MKEFQLSRYIKKWLPLIVVLCVGLTAAVYLFLSSSRQYVASAVIQYTDPQAEQGLTPLGTPLDVNEIKSSSIFSRVITNLELDGSYSVDDLISRVTITPVVDEDKVAQKEALLEEGEEYVYEPTTYIISFAATNSEGASFGRRVLDEMLDLYFADYSENYINVESISNSLSKIYEENFDYIEMMELIDENVSNTVASLYQRVSSAPYYRATSTGMSFTDLADAFNYLQRVKVSALFSTIFEYQVTKDKNVLISDYSTRIENHDIDNLAYEKQIDDVMELIDAYVVKMRDSGNTDITYEYILDDVYDRDLTDADGNPIYSGDQTVTYDKLIYSWRDHNESKEYAIIDSAYCQYIINVFSACTGACPEAVEAEPEPEEQTVVPPQEMDWAQYYAAQQAAVTADGAEATDTEDAADAAEDDAAVNPDTACARSDLTCTQLNNPEYDAIEAQVETDIQVLVDELERLYQLTSTTNDEYNEYQGAQNISMLSTASVTESVNVGLYTGIAAVFLLVLCCCGAILLGRLNDIVQYMFYTDHMTGLNNRVSFDNYLKARDQKILDDGTVCATIAVTNQVAFNREFGRDAGDELIRLFADTLKDVFRKTGATIVYNGNAHFVVVVEKTDYVTAEYILHRFRLLIDKRENLKEGRIEYEIGLAETYRDKVHKIRGLLSKASAAQTRYVSEAAEEAPQA